MLDSSGADTEHPWENLKPETKVNVGSLPMAIREWGRQHITEAEDEKLRRWYSTTGLNKSPEDRLDEVPEIVNRGSREVSVEFTDLDGKKYKIPMTLSVDAEEEGELSVATLRWGRLHRGQGSFPLSSGDLVAPIDVLARFDRAMRHVGDWQHEEIPEPPLKKTGGYWKRDPDYSASGTPARTVIWNNYDSRAYGYDPDNPLSRTTRGFGQTPETFGQMLNLVTNGNIKIR